MLYARDDDHLFAPASNTKLFTTALALTMLGPEYRFKTTVVADNADLVFVGGGDPSLSPRHYPYEKSRSGQQAEPFETIAAIEELAETSGALLATTLPGRGMFDHNPFSLGVAGGFASQVARDLFPESDLVLAIGASLTYYTVDGGNLFPKAFTASSSP